MKDGTQAWRRWTSLRVRLAVLLSIAVLPLGIVAVVQTAQVVREAQRLERSDLLSRTVSAVSAERALLRRAYGAAEALGAAAISTGSDDPACTAIMQRFVAENDAIIFSGFAESGGIMRCISTGDPIDLSTLDDWQSFEANPRPMIAYNPQGAATGQPVLIATVPIFDEMGDFLGGASVSLPGALLDTLLDPQFEGVKLALLDASGTVLASSVDSAQIERLHLVPSELNVTNAGFTRDVTTADGQTALAVIVPLIGQRVYVLGVYEGLAGAQSVPFLGTGAPLFPILMWVIALGVGILAVDRLVLRHLRVLRHRMASFSFENPADSFAILDGPPREVAQIAGTYNRMVDRILGDRTELADALDEKELLLREVHHRVKNNLQLIGSMLNIQIRSIPEGRSRLILRRMQDRVMGLSSIHKALYSGSQLSHVRADRLLQEVLQSTLNIGLPAGAGVEARMDLDPVTLDPDQAVPLTLLASELTTNAIKYVGRPATGKPTIRLSLNMIGNDIVLGVENTLGTAVQEETATEGTGLGAQLIEAFVSQLGGTLDVDQTESVYSVTVVCPDLRVDSIDPDEDTDGDDPDAGDPDITLPRAS